MTDFTITTIGDPLLAQPAPAVAGFAETQPMFHRLTEALRELRGAGLAAPQIGIGVAAAVIEVRKTELFPDRPESPLIRLANPVIDAMSDEIVEEWEGCFSVPGLLGIVPRPNEVTVSFRDAEWNQVTQTFTGYVARVVQHEVDHLHGRVFLSRMTSLDSLTTQENFLKRGR